MRAQEQTSDRLLTIKQVVERLPIKDTTFRTGISRGLYPPPIRIGRRKFWRQSTVDQMLNDFIEGKLDTPKGPYLPNNHSEDAQSGGEDSAIFRSERAKHAERINAAPSSPLQVVASPDEPPSHPRMRRRAP